MDTRYGYTVEGPQSKRKPVVLVIDSTDMFEQHNYTVEIPVYRDVVSIELTKAVVPNPADDNYLILKIAGYDTIHGNTSVLEGAFCTLERSLAVGAPIVFQRNAANRNIHYLAGPAKLGRLQISFFKPDGTVPNFIGTTHMLTLELNTLNQPSVPF